MENIPLKKRHIGMIISRYPPVIGGTEIQCQRLSQALVADGYEVVVLTEKRSSWWLSREVKDGVTARRLRTLGNPPVSSFLFCLQLLGRFRRLLGFDILHSHMVGAYGVCVLAFGRLFRKPVLIKIAGGKKTGELYLSQQSMMGRLKLSFLKRWARHIVCPSQELVSEWRSAGFREDVFHCIPNGVEVRPVMSAGSRNKSELRTALGISPDHFVAVYAGRANPGKGVDILFQLWRQALRLTDFRWSLIILTPKNSWPAPYTIEANDLAARIKVVFDPAQVEPYYHASDLAILLSKGEGLSNFLLEAMAAGLPTLTTQAASVGNPPENQTWGWVLPGTQSPEQEALEILQQLQKNPAPLLSKGAQARQKIEASYSLSQVAKQYEALYEKMIQEQQRTA